MGRCASIGPYGGGLRAINDRPYERNVGAVTDRPKGCKRGYSVNRKQEVFIQEYLVDMNASAAARRAGYSYKHARATASKILARPDVQAVVQEALRQRKLENGLSGERVRKALSDIAFGQAEGAAVGHKVRCLELLAKMLGLFEGNRDVEPVMVIEDV